MKKHCFIILFLLICGCKGDEKQNKSILKPMRKTMWYPSTKSELNNIIGRFMSTAPVSTKSDVLGLIVPHAGYVYSGKNAAFAFKSIKDVDRYKRVIVIGPSHSHYLNNRLVVPTTGYYETPLGKMSIDESFVDALLKLPYVKKDDAPFNGEHSVDNEIPFAQYTLKDFQIVPMIMGHCDWKVIKEVGAFLRNLMDEKTLIVISSDFTHYGANFGYQPFQNDIEENLKKLDMQAAQYIEGVKAKQFYDFKKETGVTICGAGPITLLLATLPSSSKGQLIKYDTSGQLTGDFSHTVSYLSFAFSGNWNDIKNEQDEKDEVKEIDNHRIELSENEKKDLLILARKSIETYLNSGKRVPISKDFSINITPNLKTKMGAFVTLKKKGHLRGCIGEIFPMRPLVEVVNERAVDAAVRDSRFPQLDKSELSDITIEISALTPPKEVSSYKEIEIGRHGMVLNKKGYGAVFLPQVAPEQGWDLATTLTQLSLKAGLSQDDWKEGANFQVFEAIVFHEK